MSKATTLARPSIHPFSVSHILMRVVCGRGLFFSVQLWNLSKPSSKACRHTPTGHFDSDTKLHLWPDKSFYILRLDARWATVTTTTQAPDCLIGRRLIRSGPRLEFLGWGDHRATRLPRQRESTGGHGAPCLAGRNLISTERDKSSQQTIIQCLPPSLIQPIWCVNQLVFCKIEGIKTKLNQHLEEKSL